MNIEFRMGQGLPLGKNAVYSGEVSPWVIISRNLVSSNSTSWGI